MWNDTIVKWHHHHLSLETRRESSIVSQHVIGFLFLLRLCLLIECNFLCIIIMVVMMKLVFHSRLSSNEDKFRWKDGFFPKDPLTMYSWAHSSWWALFMFDGFFMVFMHHPDERLIVKNLWFSTWNSWPFLRLCLMLSVFYYLGTLRWYLRTIFLMHDCV